MNDTYGRAINYLRLSVTDRCNLRCQYCMPSEGISQVDCEQVLRFEEFYRIVTAASTIGIRKVRITGGEPLVRKGVIEFIAKISQLPEIDEVTLTTNGMLLPGNIQALKDAGINRLNVSLDSLQSDNFTRITRGGDINKVMKGLQEAEDAGMQIKLNMVVMRGINDEEIVPFARLSLHKNWSVRYIEFMPTMRDPHWRDKIITSSQILDQLKQNFELQTLPKHQRSGPSKPYRIAGAKGTIGLISSMSDHFCGSCNRIRVTSTGLAKSCLLSNSETDLKPALQQNDLGQLVTVLENVIQNKPPEHQLDCDPESSKIFSMATIGG
jgi:GTP 3',8-cyclase